MIQNIDALCTHILQNYLYFLHRAQKHNVYQLSVFLLVILFLFLFLFFVYCLLLKIWKYSDFLVGNWSWSLIFLSYFLFGFVYRLHLKFEKAEFFYKNWLWCRLLDEVLVWGNVIQSILILQNGTMEFYSPCDIIFTTPLPSLSLENAVWFLLQLPMVSLA